MEFFATFPLTGAKRKTTTLTNELQKKPKISYSAAASEIHDDNDNGGDDEAEYYEVVEDEDEDGDGDGQDGNEDKQQHEENKNEEQNEKVKEYPANQQACAHDFGRVKLHDLQIRSLRDCCARIQESHRVEQQARMDLQLTVEELMRTIEELRETVQNQGEKNKRNEEAINECNRRLGDLEHDMRSAAKIFEIIWNRLQERRVVALRTQ
ncbi:hypothetical protein T069G_03776 [Trichoderma breve]|uniref:Uncharacterized protein n=1 Tax=Trichoderma breve TaxID=2034170 RepID=A0A9W9E9X6_9HYPO|nr:hypothetical protein T069G_03776 [Trichoderma breve]KAJ4862822.1 hypothetical protein T069G_03776 [Trichoderma breve]